MKRNNLKMKKSAIVIRIRTSMNLSRVNRRSNKRPRNLMLSLVPYSMRTWTRLKPLCQTRLMLKYQRKIRKRLQANKSQRS
jgi:hypothetical protein